jgi:hypothetical protein
MNSAATTSTITVEDLRQLAIVKHHIIVTSLDKELWTIYLKVGTGQWKTQINSKIKNVDQCVWSTDVQKMVSSKLSSGTAADKNEEKMYENEVNEYLKGLNQTIEQYETEFNEIKNSLMNWTDDMEKEIETFVEQYTIPLFQMNYNYKITVLEYDYNILLLERQYLQLKPTENQVR